MFGRLDMRPEVDPQPRYVGRIGLRDDDRDSLLIDWRAPAAAVFYQATAAEPHDVVRRRVLRCTGPRVVGVEVNPIIVNDIVRGTYAAFTGDLYRDPRVQVVVDEGRSYIRRSPEPFASIQATLVDTGYYTADQLK